MSSSIVIEYFFALSPSPNFKGFQIAPKIHVLSHAEKSNSYSEVKEEKKNHEEAEIHKVKP